MSATYQAKFPDSFCFSLRMKNGKMEASTLSIPPLPSPISSGGLEITFKAKLTIDKKHAQILKYLQQINREKLRTKY